MHLKMIWPSDIEQTSKAADIEIPLNSKNSCLCSAKKAFKICLHYSPLTQV